MRVRIADTPVTNSRAAQRVVIAMRVLCLVAATTSIASADPITVEPAEGPTPAFEVVRAAKLAPFERVEVRRITGPDEVSFTLAVKTADGWWTAPQIDTFLSGGQPCREERSLVRPPKLVPMKLADGKAVALQVDINREMSMACGGSSIAKWVERDFVVCGLGADKKAVCTAPLRADAIDNSCVKSRVERDAIVTSCEGVQDGAKVPAGRHTIALR